MVVKRLWQARASAFALVVALSCSFALHAGVLVEAGETGPFVARIIDDAQHTFPRTKRAPPVDWADLFLRDELEHDPIKLAQARDRWQQRAPVFASIGALTQLSPRERAHRVITELVINDHLSSYELASSKLSGFLVGDSPGGNCEAETRAIIAALQAANIELTGDDVLGVQTFDDHIQPVILDRRHSTVWVLLDGTVEKSIRAPIFHPSLLAHGLLLGRAIEPAVRLEELLLAAPPGAGSIRDVTRGFATDSKSTFPKSGVRSTRATPPAHGSVRVPPSPTLLFSAPAPNASTSGLASAADVDATVMQTNVQSRPRGRQENAISYESCLVSSAGSLTFRDPADGVLFNQLPTYDARARYVLEVAFRDASSVVLREPSLREMLSRGETLELRQKLRDLHSIVDAAECARESITSLAVASKIFAGQSFVGDEEPFVSLAQRVDQAPHVADATHEVDELFKAIAAHPAWFVRDLTRLSHDSRALLLTLLPAREHARVIAPVLRSIRIESTARDLATEMAEPREWIEVDLSAFQPLAEASTSPTSPTLDPAARQNSTLDSTGTLPPRAQTNDETAHEQEIPIEVFLDLLIFWVSQRPESLFEGLPQDAKQHWSDSVEIAWKQRKAKTPRREQLYVDHLASLLNALPTKAPHPLPSRVHGSDAPRAVQRRVH
ncbi:MAG: hypothetical protein U0165_13110 [Polyangiaceae bacterium]